MASLPPPPPPPAASQGVASKSTAGREDDDIWCPIKVATYNVGASQEEAFQSSAKLEPFKNKLLVRSKGETCGRAGIHHPKGIPRGRAHPSGGARPLLGPGGGYLISDPPASPVQAECAVLKMSVDVVCFQELSGP